MRIQLEKGLFNFCLNEELKTVTLILRANVTKLIYSQFTIRVKISEQSPKPP
jgi:hypothetical protein